MTKTRMMSDEDDEDDDEDRDKCVSFSEKLTAESARQISG